MFFEKVKTILPETFGAGSFDYLINNAGIGIGVAIADTTKEQFVTLMNLHFKGVFFLTQKALPLMNDGGGIVNISSGLARFTSPMYAACASLKGGIKVFTRYLASEMGKRGIRADVVARER